MPFYFFLWDDSTLSHLQENGVSAEKFEEVVSSAEYVTKSNSSQRPATIGYTQEERLLVCVYEFVDAETILPITAFEPEKE